MATEVSRVYRRLNVIGALFLVLLIIAVQFIRADEEGLRVFGARAPRLCWVRTLTKRPCLTCGLSRSTLMVLQGNWAESARFHPSGIPVALWIAVQVLLRGVLVVAPPQRKSLPYADLAVSLVTFLCVVYVPLLVGQ